jgi:hypothetical protein
MRRQRLGKSLIEFAKKNNVPSVGPGGDAWLNQTNKNKNAFNKRIRMDANLGVMTIRRHSRREVSPITRWSRSFSKNIGSNREPLSRVSSYGSAIHSRFANAAPSNQKQCANIFLT